MLCAEEDIRRDGKILLHIENLHCAACAADLEEDLGKIKGVKEVRVDFISQTILWMRKNDDAVRKVIKTANKFDKVRVLDGDKIVSKKESRLKEVLQIAGCRPRSFSSDLFSIIL